MPQIFNAVIGTAGHIDHGKSTLVHALTGIHPDRLKEEQERGITIDLGFAPLELKNGLRVGIIDVPGHERFIKNMVAGASGIDFVMLVVAADDGVMAQTREHLQILRLLGVSGGVTVITKKDLVAPDYLALVIEDVQALLAGTFLAGQPIIPVSAKTGEGVPELKAALEDLLPKLNRRAASGPFRMPIQRVFVKEGFGTVVTGVPLSGEVAIGDALDILPPGYRGRVKTLQAYKNPITRGQAGHSTAINLHGPELGKQGQKPARGMVAVTPDVFEPGNLFTARLTHLAGSPWPLKHRAPVRFHSGTAEIQGKVLLLEGDQLLPGVEGWIQILLAEPTVLAPGDRFILRHQTPVLTLGGGRIVDVVPQKRKRRRPEVIAELTQRWSCLDRPAEFIGHILAAAAAPKELNELCHETGLLPRTIQQLIDTLAKDNLALTLPSPRTEEETTFVAPPVLEKLLQTVLRCIEAYLKEHPALGGIERPELRRRLELSLGARGAAHADSLLAILARRKLAALDSNLVSLPGRERRLEGAWAEQAQAAEALWLAGGLAPPTPAEAEARLKIAPKVFREILCFLRETGRLVEAAPEIYFHAQNIETAKSETLILFAQKPECTTSEIRQRLKMNRKYVVPLVEIFDKQGFTVRSGDKRKIGPTGDRASG